MTIGSKRPINHFLATDGGVFEFTGDYSGVNATRAKITADARHRVHMVRMIVLIRDGGITPSKFGGIAALTNGISFSLDAGGETLEDISIIPIKSNADFGRYCYDMTIDRTGAGDDFVLVRWSFDKAYGADAVTLEPGMSLEMHLDDDLTGLTDFTVLIQGTRERIAL